MTKPRRRASDYGVQNPGGEIYGRISQVEQEQASILANLQNLSRSMESIAQEIRGLKDSKSTNWGVLAGWATVIILVMSTIGNLTISPVVKALDHHMAREGHLQTVKSLASIEQEMDDHKDQYLIDSIRLFFTRFNRSDGEGINGRVQDLKERLDIFDNEQRRRTSRVYSE